MQSNFEACLRRVLVHEGGYVNHPLDPGGATCYGITQRVYNGWRKLHEQPIRSVRAIEDAEVRAIYSHNYWEPSRAAWLAAGVDYALFDVVVNSGLRRGVIILQRAINSLGKRRIKVDGLIGPATIAAARECSPAALIDAICDKRLGYIRHLDRLFSTFGKGWTRRVAEVRRDARWMAASAAHQVANDNQQVKKAA